MDDYNETQPLRHRRKSEKFAAGVLLMVKTATFPAFSKSSVTRPVSVGSCGDVGASAHFGKKGAATAKVQHRIANNPADRYRIPVTRPIPLGQSLVSLGHLTAETLAEALRRQADLPGIRIGRILLDLGVSEDLVTEALALQKGLSWMKLSDRILPADLALRLPHEYARRHKMIPVEDKDGFLLLAVVNPAARSEAEMVGRFFDKPIRTVLVSESDMEIALDRAYGRKGNKVEGTDQPDEAVAVRLLDSLLSRAARDGASDIHIEPFESHLRVRVRVDGILHDVAVEDVSPRALAARCKILADLDTAENRRPQDGRFRSKSEGRTIDVRVSTIPTAFGEKVVLRLLDRTRALLNMSALGMTGGTLENFGRAILRPHGLILVTGPTGSGKTTTLYAALSERNHEGLNITTIEDPVEYDLFGVNQIQVHPKIELTFAKGLRHILRQDPDIILVGEIRDRETAEVAIQAAMTGHLVLSTLHTNSAVGAVARLLDMGIEPFLVADALLVVLSQRLVRRVCVACNAAGCTICLGTGFRGRVGLYELLDVAPISSLIRTNASSEEIVAAARLQGHETLRDDGLIKVREGVTTLDEVERVA